MILPYKISLGFLLLAGLFAAGYFSGCQQGRKTTLKAAVSAYQLRGQINHETDNLDPVALCHALGGLREECATLLRGMDKAP